MKKSWLIGITLSANIVSLKVNFDSKQQQQQQQKPVLNLWQNQFASLLKCL